MAGPFQDVVIVGAARTPLGSFRSAFDKVPVAVLGAAAIKGALKNAKLKPSMVQEVFMGCVVPSGAGQAPARQAVLEAGCNVSTIVTAINKVCASGMKSIACAASLLQLDLQERLDIPSFPVTKLSTCRLHVLKFGTYNRHCTIKYVVSQFAFSIEDTAKDEEYTRVNFQKIPKLRAVFSKGCCKMCSKSTLNFRCLAVAPALVIPKVGTEEDRRKDLLIRLMQTHKQGCFHWLI
uniref:Thiolase N-terminal domain-containing protein n=1 Tax=Parascaris equorum TaxID=6256 RepID=A0A914S4X1_PAREQ